MFLFDHAQVDEFYVVMDRGNRAFVTLMSRKPVPTHVAGYDKFEEPSFSEKPRHMQMLPSSFDIVFLKINRKPDALFTLRWTDYRQKFL